MMIGTLFLAGLFMFGAIFGSFACCQAYRLRYKNLGKKIGNRSECLYCGHQLRWFEMVPVISWLILRGKCGECKKAIGWIELGSEIGMGMIFTLLGFKFLDLLGYWEKGGIKFNIGVIEEAGQNFIIVLIIKYGILILLSVLFWILFVYDLKWKELPRRILYLSIILSVIYFVIEELGRLGVITRGALDIMGAKHLVHRKMNLGGGQISVFFMRDMWSFGGSLLILPVLYFLLYKLSRERLVGGGDYLIGIAIACLLLRVELTMFVLFLSNFLAFVINFRKAFVRKEKRIAFGPYLIMAFWIVFFLADSILRYFYIV